MGVEYCRVHPSGEAGIAGVSPGGSVCHAEAGGLVLMVVGAFQEFEKDRRRMRRPKANRVPEGREEEGFQRSQGGQWTAWIASVAEEARIISASGLDTQVAGGFI